MLVAVSVLVAFSASAAVEIASPAPSGAQPFLSAGRSGLIMSWTDRAAVRFSRFDGTSWSKPQTIVERNDLFVNWADFPSVVEDVNGVLFAHWLQKSGSSGYAYDVRMAISRDGGATWTASIVLNRDGKKNEHGFVSLEPLPNGGVAAAWLDGRNMPEGKEEGDMTLRYATVDANGRIAHESALDRRTCECCTTGMALVGDKPLVVYRDRSPADVRDIAIVRRTARRWTSPSIVHRDGWKINGCPVNGPQIATSGRNVAVAWFTAASDRQRVYVAFSSDGGSTFSKPVVVDDGKPVGRVDVVLAGAKTAIVSWIEQTVQGAELRARAVRRGVTEPSVKIADSSAARSSGFPRMAGVNGDVFVAWTDRTQTTTRVRVARLSGLQLARSQHE